MTSTPTNILNKIREAEKSKKLDLSASPMYGRKNTLELIPPEVFELTELEELNLSVNKLTVIPSDIRKLKNLTLLDLSFNTISDIPKELVDLKYLHTLNLSYIESIKDFSIIPKLTALKNLNIHASNYRDRISSIPLEVLKLNSLESLNISGRNLEDITEKHIDLNGLKSIYLSGCKLKEVPAWINKLESLRTLDLSDNKLSTITEITASLSSLSSLLIDNNSIETLPNWITQLSHLTELSIGGNKNIKIPEWISSLRLDSLGLSDLNLKRIPNIIFKLNDLKELILYSNKLTLTEDEISRLQSIKQLNLAINPIRSLKPILALKNLEHLTIGGCKITEFPNDIDLLKNLTRLWAISNEIKTLPESFGNLKNLKMVGLSNNAFENLPECIYELENLEELYIGNNLNHSKDRKNNQIRTISPKILKLINLKELDVSENPIESPPQEIVETGLDAIKNYFRQIEAEGIDYLYEAKLLILGEGGAGKTTLAKKIADPNYVLQDSEKSTEGIDISHWNFITENKNKFQINIWDFGGQEIYHATHQFFLTKRSLYILLADTRKDDTDFHYWLNVVELLSDNSPILIIKNEKQDRHREINEIQFRGQFANLKEILAGNLATNRGLESILANIRHYASQLPHIGAPLPKTWVKIRETLEKEKRTYISYTEYINICNNNNFTSQPDQLQLIGFLHDLGICLYFQDDPILQKTVILKPKWGTDAAYKVLDNKDVIKNLGHFSKSDLAKIWHEAEYAGMLVELLQLMMKFRLCYMVPGSDGVYIAPQLLTENQPKYDWDMTNNLTLRYTYEFMPKGIITQFIVVMHNYILNKNCVWKSGIVLERDDTKAEVIEYYGKREISVRVTGKNQREFFAVITYELSKIHDTYKRLKYNELVPCKCKLCKDDQEPHFYTLKILKKFTQDNQPIQCQKSYEMIDAKSMLDEVLSQDTSRKEMVYLKDGKSISFEGANINQIILQQTTQAGIEISHQNISEEKMSKKESLPKSAWANGLFYLLVFVVVIAGLGVLANSVPWYTLAIILVAAVIFVPLVGALQLRQDKNLSEKGFLELISLVLRQLPLIERLYKNK